VSARLRPVLAVPAGIFVAAWAVIAHYAVRVHTLQPDEVIPISGSRYLLEHPLQALGSGSVLSGRGLERGVAITFAVVQWVLGNTGDAFWLEHVLMAGLVAATALVMWSWGRELGLAAWQAGLAAALAVCVPWVILGTSFLNSAGALCLTPLALYAMWRATARPSVRRDVVALLALLLLGCWRVGNIVVAAVWPLAIVLFALHDGSSLRALPLRVWRSHRLLVVLGAIGIAALLLGGTHWLIGGYPTRGALWPNLRSLLRAETAALAVGTGVVPVVIALAWFVRSLVRPTAPALAAFATVALGAFLILCYVAATQGVEERYLAPAAPAVLLAFVVALARREAPVLLVMAAAVLVARLIAINGPGSDQFGAYQYFHSTAVAFFRRVVLGKASLAIPFTDHHVLTTLVIALGVIAVAGAWWKHRLVLPLLAVGAGAWGAAGGIYAMHQFVQQAGLPNLSFSAQAWIDGRAGPGSQVFLTGAGLENVRRELAVFNRSLGNPYEPRELDLGTADLATGVLGPGAPRWIVHSEGFQPEGVDGRVVAKTTYLPQNAVLERLDTPRLVYRVLRGSPFALRVYGSGCMAIEFQAPPGKRRRWSFGGARGITDGTQPVRVTRPLRAPYDDYALRVPGGADVLSVARGC
jgi:hypothetical protein